jgi:hypothetical protein
LHRQIRAQSIRIAHQAEREDVLIRRHESLCTQLVDALSNCIAFAGRGDRRMLDALQRVLALLK